jgi:hypothetical protein
MNPEEVPIPLEKTVEIKNGTVEVSIAEKKMSDKEKKAYRKFMAKCVNGATDKSEKDAMLACAVDFEKVKEKIMAEDDLEEIEEEEEDEEDEEEEVEESESSIKKQGKIAYREKPKNFTNSIKIITVEQIRKLEKHEKGETAEDERKETKEAWRNTVDL